jgi:signal transduction histidine kinase
VSILLLTQSVFWVGRVILIIAEIVLCCVMYEDRWGKCVSIYLSKEAVRLISAAITALIYRYVSGGAVGFFGPFGNENIACFLLYLIMYSVLAAMTLQFIRGERGAQVPWIIGTQAVLLVGETAAITAVVQTSEAGINIKHTPYAVIAAFFMVIANVSIGILIPYLLNKISMANDMVYGQELSNMEYKYYEMSVEKEKKMQMIRHEISNQIQTAYAMFQSGENQRGLEFINDLKSRYAMGEPIVYCSNPLLNIILSNKKHEAEEKQIEFQIRIKQDLEKITVSDFDLSTVICNLLDNAIRGCECSGQNSPKLTIEILEKNQYLVIRVLNSCKVSMKIDNTDRIKTTKNNSQAHGLGMPIIAEITRRYRGDFIVSAKNGLFTATVVMSLK